MSELIITEDKRFTKEDVEGLFLSVGWKSGSFPNKLIQALSQSSTVVTIWENDQLVGLARALDDGAMLAFIHYVLVRPSHQGSGLAKMMINHLKNKYKEYLYIQLMPESASNAPFYEKMGFSVMENGVPMIHINQSFNDQV